MENKIKFNIISLVSLFISLIFLAIGVSNSIKDNQSFWQPLLIFLIPVIFSLIPIFLKTDILKIICFSLVIIFYIVIFILMLLPKSAI